MTSYQSTQEMKEEAREGAPSSSRAITIELTAQSMAFDKKTLTVPAGAQVTLNFHNRDSGVPHNFSLYQSSSAQEVIFKGEIITGVSDTTYNFTSPDKPGTYFFRCDVHPRTMTGDFVVQ